jgi:hypothetical protein
MTRRRSVAAFGTRGCVEGVGLFGGWSVVKGVLECTVDSFDETRLWFCDSEGQGPVFCGRSQSPGADPARRSAAGAAERIWLSSPAASGLPTGVSGSAST